MKIKYTGLYETIYVKEPSMGIDYYFERNRWKDIRQDHADYILKSWYFVSEKDFIFDREFLINSKPLKIALDRFGAMGDLVQLIPIIKEIKKIIPQHKIYLVTAQEYVYIFKNSKEIFEDVVDYSAFQMNLFDKRISLDGVLESDHSLTNEEAQMHRVEIYERFFGIKCEKYDFSFEISNDDKIKVEEVLKNVCL